MSRAPGWDPDQYDRFEAQRDRPARDLIANLPADLAPGVVWDLGCGTGRHAAEFARRWPAARVHGLDLDPAMLAVCRARPEPVVWVEGNATAWRAPQPADLIFANASLHWVRDHEALFPNLIKGLTPGGVLAVQMPLQAGTRHHDAIARVASAGPWAAVLAAVSTPAPLPSPEELPRSADRCRGGGRRLDDHLPPRLVRPGRRSGMAEGGRAASAPRGPGGCT